MLKTFLCLSLLDIQVLLGDAVVLAEGHQGKQVCHHIADRDRIRIKFLVLKSIVQNLSQLALALDLQDSFVFSVQEHPGDAGKIHAVHI